MLADNMVLALSLGQDIRMPSNPSYWQYRKILILGGRNMYPEYVVFEAKPVLAGIELFEKSFAFGTEQGKIKFHRW
jgi:hypothetical protein